VGDEKPTGLVTEIANQLGSIYRHMLPGVLVIGGARLAYREWFQWVNLESWKHLLLLATVAVVVGNVWFALNRYGLHQFVDMILYSLRVNGPARRLRAQFDYTDELGRYVHKSLKTPETLARARQHVGFRASSALLLLTLGEAMVLFGWHHAPTSIFSGSGFWLIAASSLPFAVGLWQMVLTRRIDFYIVSEQE
jgi:hypothetical protein